MIKTEQLIINYKQFTKSYSDSGYMIERDGVQYSEAIDPTELGRTYTETDIPIEGEGASDTEQKAAAFDYLTGRSVGNE
jgi:hypothetical protein